MTQEEKEMVFQSSLRKSRSIYRMSSKNLNKMSSKVGVDRTSGEPKIHKSRTLKLDSGSKNRL